MKAAVAALGHNPTAPSPHPHCLLPPATLAACSPAALQERAAAASEPQPTVAMDVINAAMNQKLDLGVMLKDNDVSASTQGHLARVYTLLAGGLAVSAAGAWVHTVTGMGGILSSFAAFGLLMWLAMDTVRGA